MEDRQAQIVEGAIGLFLRYGVRRTGMSDIAHEAGISRQTLYKEFANKDAVLQATIRSLADKVVLDIESRLEQASGLGEQLDVVFTHAVVEHFDLLQSSPNADDIISGVSESSQDELEAGARRNTEILTRLLAPFADEIERQGLTVRQLADFVLRAATATKYSSKSRRHLNAQLAALRVSVLKVTGAAR